MSKWNPMAEEFLSARNAYTVNDEDAQQALLGYGILIHITIMCL